MVIYINFYIYFCVIESKHVAQSKDTLLALLQAATSEIEEEAEV